MIPWGDKHLSDVTTNHDRSTTTTYFSRVLGRLGISTLMGLECDSMYV